ncbi:hypothetical protein [Streptomyces sp. NPDC058657]|uniref:hypothetical protein n=1 Tax=unclassified Streptomyces TaxID=2593676 RepID=UPI003660B47A
MMGLWSTVWIDRISARTDWEPLNLDVPWGEIEDALDTLLPEDYKGLVETFGKGEFSEFFRILTADSAKTFDLLHWWNSYCARSPRGESDPLLGPYQVYRPNLPGLIPWAHGELKTGYFWLASSEVDPSNWPILTRSDRYPWQQVNMSTSEFLYRVLTDTDFEPFSIARLFPDPDFYPF